MSQHLPQPSTSLSSSVGSITPSRFNVPVETQPGELFALYNTSTGNYVVLTDELRDLYSRAARHGVHMEDGGMLYRAGFLVEENVDELDAIRQVFEASRRGRYSPHLTIAPTLDCNFGCAYCFESHQVGLMPDATQQLLVTFLESLIQTLGMSPGLSVSWFGGEPLMALPVLRRLSTQFLRLRESQRLVSYSADLITNGYSLTPNVCEELLTLGIRHAQITLDGPAAVHDTRRHLKRGPGATFARIIDNMRGCPQALAITVRMNVDRENRAHAVGLFEELDRAGVLPRVNVTLAKVENFSCVPDPKTVMTSAEFAAFKSDMIQCCRAHGWPLQVDRPRPRLVGVCQVDSVNSFVIDPRGRLFKCWAELGNGGDEVGNLHDPTTWREILQTPLTTRDPFDDSECRACNLLPTCMGGCPKLRQLRRADGRKECPPHKYNFVHLVRATHGEKSNVKIWLR